MLHSEHEILSQELKRMDRFLALLNTAVTENQEQLDASFAEVTSTLSAAEKKKAYIVLLDQFLEAGTHFPRLLYSSFVVSWYSFVENHLIDFCKAQKLKISISIQDTENYGDGIRRAYNFLSRAASYQIDNAHWQELIRIGKTRNSIVHNGGRLPYSPINMPNNGIPVEVIDGKLTLYLQIEEDLYRYLQTNHLFDTDIDATPQVTPSYEYCQHLVKFGFEFFGKLYMDFNKESKTQQQKGKGG